MNLYQNWLSPAALLLLAGFFAAPASALTERFCPAVKGSAAILSVIKTTSTTASLAWTVPIGATIISGYMIESVGPGGTKVLAGNVNSYDLPVSCASYTHRVAFYQYASCPGPWSNTVSTSCPPSTTTVVAPAPAPTPAPTTGWTQVGAGLTFTNASVGSSTTFGGIVGGKHYAWNGSSFVADSMSMMQVDYGSDGTRWGVAADTSIYRRDAAWTTIPGSLKQVSVGDATNVWGTNAGGSIYKWTGAGWTAMPGAAVNAAVGSDGAVWVVNGADQIWRWNGTGWDKIPGALRWISVGSAANVWGVNAEGWVYKFNTSTGGWDRPVVPAGSFIGVSTTTDGTTLLLRSDGTLWKK